MRRHRSNFYSTEYQVLPMSQDADNQTYSSAAACRFLVTPLDGNNRQLEGSVNCNPRGRSRPSAEIIVSWRGRSRPSAEIVVSWRGRSRPSAEIIVS